MRETQLIIIIQAKYTFPANSNQYRFNNEFVSNQKLLTLHSIASFDLQLSVAPRPHGEPLREARFPDFQAHLRSTRQHRRRPSPAPSAASTARSLPQDLRSFPRRGCNWPPAIWRGFASSIRTW